MVILGTVFFSLVSDSGFRLALEMPMPTGGMKRGAQEGYPQTRENVDCARQARGAKQARDSQRL